MFRHQLYSLLFSTCNFHSFSIQYSDILLNLIILSIKLQFCNFQLIFYSLIYPNSFPFQFSYIPKFSARHSLLTSIDDLAKEILASQKVARGAVPATIAKLMLAFADGQIGALDQGAQHARIVADEPALLAAQC